FIDIDVRSRSTNHRAPARQHCLQTHHVCASSIKDWIRGGGGAKMLHDDIVKQCRVLIRPVCRLVSAVSRRHGCQNLRGNARIVIGSETVCLYVMQGFHAGLLRDFSALQKIVHQSQRELVAVHAALSKLVECEGGEPEPTNPRKSELPYVIPVIFSSFCFLPR